MAGRSGEEARPSAVALALGGCIALAAAMGIGRFVYTPILPFMEQGLGLTKAEAGWIASANFLGYLLGALAASRSHLPGGQRAWFLAALALSALTTLAMGLVDGMAVFLVLRFVGGVASAFVLIFASALVLERLTAAGRGGLSAVHFAGVGCGIAASALLVAGLAGAGQDWRVLWLASGGLSILALGLVFFLVPPAPEGGAAAPASDGGGRARRRLALLTTAYGLFGFGYVITATFISSLVRASPELQPIEPLVWLAVGLSAVPSVALWTWIGGRLGYHRSFVIACLLEAAGVAMTVLAENALAVIAGAALLGGTFMGLTAVGLIHARRLSGGNPRRSLALMTAAFGLGQMIGPAFAGYAYRLGDSFLAPSLTAAAALVIAAALAMRTAADNSGAVH